MNRKKRRAEAAKARRSEGDGRASVITTAMDFLANIAEDTATGCTILHPDGTSTYISVEDARAFYGRAPAKGSA